MAMTHSIESDIPVTGPLGVSSQKNPVEFRYSRLKYAVATSLSSKVTTALVQLIALPVAVKALGNSCFTLYAMITAAVAWLALTNLGIGPALVVRIAEAHARGDADSERCLFVSALLPVTILAFCTSIIALSLVWTFNISTLFGPNYVGDIGTIRSGLSILILLFFVQAILSLFEAAQSGYQEQYVYNLNATVSSIPCFIAILAVAKSGATVVGMILAVNAPVVIFRILNALWVLKAHENLRMVPEAFRKGLAVSLLKHGVSYSLAGGFGNFLAHVYPVILVGRALPPVHSAAFAATMNALVLASSVLSMVYLPMWSAIADSLARGEIEWAKKARRRLVTASAVYGLIVGLGFAFLGQSVFRFWFQGALHPDRSLLIACGIYFFALCWEGPHFTILVGLRQIHFASLVFLARTALSAVLMSLMIRYFGVVAPFAVMSVMVLIITSWSFPILTNRALRHKGIAFVNRS